MLVISYTPGEEEEIVREKTNAGYMLVEVQNILQGNFLCFREPGWLPPAEVVSLTEQIAILKESDLTNKEMINGLGNMIAAMLGS